MKDDDKCFIKFKNGIYKEITYKELEKRRKRYITYKDKKFIPIQNCLMEVSLDKYKEFYQDIEHQKYIKKLKKNYNIISIEKINDEDFKGKDILADTNVDIESEVERKEEIEKLKKALLLLNTEEYNLIKALFFNGRTVREYAEIKDIPYSTIQYKKKIVLEKLKKLLKI